MKIYSVIACSLIICSSLAVADPQPTPTPINPPMPYVPGYVPQMPTGSAMGQTILQQQQQMQYQQLQIQNAQNAAAARSQAAKDAAAQAAQKHQNQIDNLLSQCQSTNLNQAGFKLRAKCNAVQNSVNYHQHLDDSVLVGVSTEKK